MAQELYSPDLALGIFQTLNTVNVDQLTALGMALTDLARAEQQIAEQRAFVTGFRAGYLSSETAQALKTESMREAACDAEMGAVATYQDALLAIRTQEDAIRRAKAAAEVAREALSCGRTALLTLGNIAAGAAAWRKPGE